MTVASPLERLADLEPSDRETLLASEAERQGITVDHLRALLLRTWRFTGRPKQHPPDGDWTFWWILAGRGFGKTISASHWVKDRGLESRCRIGVIAPTLGDVRSTCFEGVTGVLSVIPPGALLGQSPSIAWNKSLLELTLANGTIIKGFSSEEPDRLRGPQHHYVWGEEVSSWKDAPHGDSLNTTFSNMKLGLRLGDRPRAVLTSTPKPNKLTKELAALDASLLALVRGSSYENRVNLPEAYWEAVVAPLEGTRTGRQEIEAEIIEDVEGALWTKAMIDGLRVKEAPPLARIVVAVDPNTTSGESADAAGIVVAGLGQRDQHGYILDDRTQVRGGPRAWAQAAVDAYHDWQADRIVVETNNGGEMCEMVIHGVDPTVPVKMITASRGKRTRAEPVAALYESDDEHARVGRVHHVGPAANFVHLEEEMTTWTPADDSPNRMDACLVAGTLVATRRGAVPIENVLVDDAVLTRRGWRRVVWAEMTRPVAPTITVEMTDGRILTGTGEHPVWVEGRGFTRIDALVCGDIMVTCKNETTSGFKASGTRDSLTHRGRPHAITSAPRAAAARINSTVKSGKAPTGPYPQATTSITSTETHSTTRSRTSASSLRLSTPPFTPNRSASNGANGSTRSDPWRPSGMGLRKVSLGIGNTVAALGRDASRDRSFASNAEGRLIAGFLRAVISAGRSVAASARALWLTARDATSSMRSARSAVPRSSRTGIGTSPQPAPVAVARSYESYAQPVYNLEVEGEHEFFANGVLVHNCVWAITDLKLWAPPPTPMRTYVPGKDSKGVEVNIAPDRFGAMNGL